MRQQTKEALAELALQQGAEVVSQALRRAMRSPRYTSAQRVVRAYRRLREAGASATPEDCRRELLEAQDAMIAFLSDEACSEDQGERFEVSPEANGHEPQDRDQRE